MVKQFDAAPGMKFHLIGPEDILSLPVAGASLVNDGDVVVRSSDGKTVSAVTDETNIKFGIILRHGVGKSGKNSAGKEAYQATDIAPVMMIGSIYVKVTAPVTDINAKVYVKTANGTTLAPLGSLSPTALDGTELPNASWETISNEQGLTEAVARVSGYKGHMRDLQLSVAKDIYRKQYWTSPRFDQVNVISTAVAEELLDTGVNCGTGFAKPLLQRALNLLNNQGKGGWPDLVVDGVYGSATLNALKTYMAKRGKDGEKVLLRVLNIMQGQRYIEICERNPSQEQFFYGWINNRIT